MKLKTRHSIIFYVPLPYLAALLIATARAKIDLKQVFNRGIPQAYVQLQVDNTIIQVLCVYSCKAFNNSNPNFPHKLNGRL